LHRRILTPPIKMDEDFVADVPSESEPMVDPEPSPRSKPVVVPDVEKPTQIPGAPDGKERRQGDRRKGNDPNYKGPERRKGERRNMDKLRHDLNWQLAPEVENKILSGMKFGANRRSGFKPVRLVLLMVALIAGGLAAFLTGERTEKTAQIMPVIAPPPPVVEVLPRILVAKKTVDIGQRLTADLVEWQDWPTDLVRGDYISFDNAPEAIKDLSGAMTRFEFFEGEPIREQKLVRDAGGYLSSIIAKGLRGVSVSVSGQAASGGFIVPNDRVDVVLTRDAPQGQVSETILRNVRVLAVNSRVGELSDNGKQVERDELLKEMLESDVVATLELDSAEAEIIVAATTLGKFALVLRSMSDFSNGKLPERSGVNQAIRMTSPFWNPPANQRVLR